MNKKHNHHIQLQNHTPQHKHHKTYSNYTPNLFVGISHLDSKSPSLSLKVSNNTNASKRYNFSQDYTNEHESLVEEQSQSNDQISPQQTHNKSGSSSSSCFKMDFHMSNEINPVQSLKQMDQNIIPKSQRSSTHKTSSPIKRHEKENQPALQSLIPQELTLSQKISKLSYMNEEIKERTVYKRNLNEDSISKRDSHMKKQLAIVRQICDSDSNSSSTCHPNLDLIGLLNESPQKSRQYGSSNILLLSSKFNSTSKNGDIRTSVNDNEGGSVYSKNNIMEKQPGKILRRCGSSVKRKSNESGIRSGESINANTMTFNAFGTIYTNETESSNHNVNPLNTSNNLNFQSHDSINKTFSQLIQRMSNQKPTTKLTAPLQYSSSEDEKSQSQEIKKVVYKQPFTYDEDLESESNEQNSVSLKKEEASNFSTCHFRKKSEGEDNSEKELTGNTELIEAGFQQIRNKLAAERIKKIQTNKLIPKEHDDTDGAKEYHQNSNAIEITDKNSIQDPKNKKVPLKSFTSYNSNNIIKQNIHEMLAQIQNFKPITQTKLKQKNQSNYEQESPNSNPKSARVLRHYEKLIDEKIRKSQKLHEQLLHQFSELDSMKTQRKKSGGSTERRNEKKILQAIKKADLQIPLEAEKMELLSYRKNNEDAEIWRRINSWKKRITNYNQIKKYQVKVIDDGNQKNKLKKMAKSKSTQNLHNPRVANYRNLSPFTTHSFSPFIQFDGRTQKELEDVNKASEEIENQRSYSSRRRNQIMRDQNYYLAQASIHHIHRYDKSSPIKAEDRDPNHQNKIEEMKKEIKHLKLISCNIDKKVRARGTFEDEDEQAKLKLKDMETFANFFVEKNKIYPDRNGVKLGRPHKNCFTFGDTQSSLQMNKAATNTFHNINPFNNKNDDEIIESNEEEENIPQDKFMTPSHPKAKHSKSTIKRSYQSTAKRKKKFTSTEKNINSSNSPKFDVHSSIRCCSTVKKPRKRLRNIEFSETKNVVRKYKFPKHVHTTTKYRNSREFKPIKYDFSKLEKFQDNEDSATNSNFQGKIENEIPKAQEIDDSNNLNLEKAQEKNKKKIIQKTKKQAQEEKILPSEYLKKLHHCEIKKLNMQQVEKKENYPKTERKKIRNGRNLAKKFHSSSPMQALGPQSSFSKMLILGYNQLKTKHVRSISFPKPFIENSEDSSSQQPLLNYRNENSNNEIFSTFSKQQLKENLHEIKNWIEKEDPIISKESEAKQELNSNHSNSPISQMEGSINTPKFTQLITKKKNCKNQFQKTINFPHLQEINRLKEKLMQFQGFNSTQAQNCNVNILEMKKPFFTHDENTEIQETNSPFLSQNIKKKCACVKECNKSNSLDEYKNTEEICEKVTEENIITERVSFEPKKIENKMSEMVGSSEIIENTTTSPNELIQKEKEKNSSDTNYILASNPNIQNESQSLSQKRKEIEISPSAHSKTLSQKFCTCANTNRNSGSFSSSTIFPPKLNTTYDNTCPNSKNHRMGALRKIKIQKKMEKFKESRENIFGDPWNFPSLTTIQNKTGENQEYATSNDGEFNLLFQSSKDHLSPLNYNSKSTSRKSSVGISKENCPTPLERQNFQAILMANSICQSKSKNNSESMQVNNKSNKKLYFQNGKVQIPKSKKEELLKDINNLDDLIMKEMESPTYLLNHQNKSKTLEIATNNQNNLLGAASELKEKIDLILQIFGQK